MTSPREQKKRQTLLEKNFSVTRTVCQQSPPMLPCCDVRKAKNTSSSLVVVVVVRPSRGFNLNETFFFSSPRLFALVRVIFSPFESPIRYGYVLCAAAGQRNAKKRVLFRFGGAYFYCFIFFDLLHPVCPPTLVPIVQCVCVCTPMRTLVQTPLSHPPH